MTLTIIITVAFRTSARLSEAYGALQQLPSSSCMRLRTELLHS
jgi:hypothetical protein